MLKLTKKVVVNNGKEFWYDTVPILIRTQDLIYVEIVDTNTIATIRMPNGGVTSFTVHESLDEIHEMCRNKE
jgi:hypothetical protein